MSLQQTKSETLPTRQACLICGKQVSELESYCSPCNMYVRQMFPALPEVDDEPEPSEEWQIGWRYIEDWTPEEIDASNLNNSDSTTARP